MAIPKKIAAVSYLNTVPFIYGIENSKAELPFELILANPATCAQLFNEGEVDIALVPVAEIPQDDDIEIITDFCIGAEGEVRSVVIMSDDPISDVKRIFVDPESRTSVQLAAYLAKHVWKIDPEWFTLDDTARVSHPEDGDAFLLIGDKVFEREGEFDYTYDLSLAWHNATTLPFVFALWVARKGIDEEVIDALNEAFNFGVEHIYEAILELRGSGYVTESYQYLTENIDFLYDGGKRAALEKFKKSGIRIEPKPMQEAGK